MQQAPANRYLFYLTPQGFAEKSRLTARYLRSSLDLYRRTRRAYDELFASCVQNGWLRIAFCGVSELAEIASLTAADSSLQILGTWDPRVEHHRFLGRPVWREWPQGVVIDAAVLTRRDDAQGTVEQLSVTLGRDRVLIPAILGSVSS